MEIRKENECDFIRLEIPSRKFYYYGGAYKLGFFGKIKQWFRKKSHKKYELIGVDEVEVSEEEMLEFRKGTKSLYVGGIDAYDKDSKGKSYGA